VYQRIPNPGYESRLSVEALAEILNARVIPKSGMELEGNVLRWA
jgi:hypothetical protein